MIIRCLLLAIGLAGQCHPSPLLNKRSPPNPDRNPDSNPVLYDPDRRINCQSDCSAVASRPICGSDGLTYDNWCVLLKTASCLGRKVTPVSLGFCPQGANENKDERPEFSGDADDGSAVSGIVVNPSPSLEAHAQGCDPNCQRHLLPVCGSDGKTYGNECLLKLDACLRQKRITVKHEGACRQKREAEDDEGGEEKEEEEKEKKEQEGEQEMEGETSEDQEDCPTVCPAIYDPVCGSDGLTHSNPCQMNAKACAAREQVQIVHEGVCQPDSPEEPKEEEEEECPTVCSFIFNPVCGSDGQTYSNECALRVAACEGQGRSSLAVARAGPCPVAAATDVEAEEDEEEGNQDCWELCQDEGPSPVCGSDGKTYTNACSVMIKACLDGVEITVASNGHCAADEDDLICHEELCTAEFRPVCGSDGETYSNSCQLSATACVERREITVKHEGPCYNQQCPQRCFADLRPVCGTDGVTYPNECAMRSKACVDGSNLQVQHRGQCSPPLIEESPVCPILCPLILSPVCGSDGQTYSSLCQMSIKACKTRSVITIRHDGPCEEAPQPEEPLEGDEAEMFEFLGTDATLMNCPIVCTLEHDPICGSNGKTYSNKCQMEKTACLEKVSITRKHKGECLKLPEEREEQQCQTFCTLEHDPICGSDGTTYSNQCHMEATACLEKVTITKKHKGECGKLPTEKEHVCPNFCTLEHDPICGSDGRTYSNKCLMDSTACREKRTIAERHRGECGKLPKEQEEELAAFLSQVNACPLQCTLDLNPVCGSNGKTFDNVCLMKFAACQDKVKIEVAHLGECREESGLEEVTATPRQGAEFCPTFCTLQYRPVCGSDGKTHSNLCKLQAAACDDQRGLTKLHDGQCQTPEPTSDGPEIEALEFDEEEENEEEDLATSAYPDQGPDNYEEIDCPILCTLQYEPVCGSDGNTHANLCALKAKSCAEENKGLRLDYEGECKKPVFEALETDEGIIEECATFCTHEFRQVCDSEGVTHANNCTLQLKNCQEHTSITVKHEGPCEEADNEEDENDKPVFSALEVEESEEEKEEEEEEEEVLCNNLCTLDYRPICGSDEVTYSNRCELESAACQQRKEITVLYDGECGQKVAQNDRVTGVQENCPEFCPLHYQPVCGTDGKSYGNDCQLFASNCVNKANIGIKHEGRCTPDDCPTECTAEQAPVCGSNGQTYTNKCMLEVAACVEEKEFVVAHSGRCEDAKVCPEACTADYDPVCGTDGVTYSNKCSLQGKSCQLGQDISVAYQGKCAVARACPEFCTADYNPVCGTDGKTYDNTCVLDTAACKANNKELRVAHDGICSSDKIIFRTEEDDDEVKPDQRLNDCPSICTPEQGSQVCGTDSVTYPNPCALRMKACQDQSDLAVRHTGSCPKPIECPVFCSAVFDPVCGSDGVTYDNSCFFKGTACRNPYLTLKSEGAC